MERFFLFVCVPAEEWFLFPYSAGASMNVWHDPESFLLHWRLTISKREASVRLLSAVYRYVQSRGSRANKRERHGEGGASANYRKKWAQSAGHLCLLADDVCFPPFILSVVPGHSTRWLSLMQKFRFYSFIFVYFFLFFFFSCLFRFIGRDRNIQEMEGRGKFRSKGNRV